MLLEAFLDLCGQLTGRKPHNIALYFYRTAPVHALQNGRPRPLVESCKLGYVYKLIPIIQEAKVADIRHLSAVKFSQPDINIIFVVTDPVLHVCIPGKRIFKSRPYGRCLLADHGALLPVAWLMY